MKETRRGKGQHETEGEYRRATLRARSVHTTSAHLYYNHDASAASEKTGKRDEEEEKEEEEG